MIASISSATKANNIVTGMHIAYKKQSCLGAIRLAGIIDPRGQCSVWKVSKWKNGLPQRQDWDQILP
jgi:hypothetical protein